MFRMLTKFKRILRLFWTKNDNDREMEITIIIGIDTRLDSKKKKIHSNVRINSQPDIILCVYSHEWIDEIYFREKNEKKSRDS